MPEWEAGSSKFEYFRLLEFGPTFRIRNFAIISFNPDGKLCQDMLTFSNNGAVQDSRITQKGRLCVFSIPRSTFELGIRMANLQIEARGPVQIVEASWK